MVGHSPCNTVEWAVQRALPSAEHCSRDTASEDSHLTATLLINQHSLVDLLRAFHVINSSDSICKSISATSCVPGTVVRLYAPCWSE